MSAAPYEIIRTTADMITTADRLSSPYFSKSSMRFFNSRVLDGIARPDGADPLAGFFVTSEKFTNPYENDGPRLYTVRAFAVERSGGFPARDRFRVETVGEFQGWETGRAARAEIARLVSAGITPESIALGE